MTALAPPSPQTLASVLAFAAKECGPSRLVRSFPAEQFCSATRVPHRSAALLPSFRPPVANSHLTDININMPDSSATTVDAYDPALGYHPSAIPLDVRLGLTSPPSHQSAPDVNKRPLRWGILGCSKVAHDFAQAQKFLRSNGLPHEIAAVGSRSMKRAEEFAALHKIPHAHGSYEEICNDATVDIVYVASLHPYHREHAELALRNGKHVLVEKPMTMKASDARFLYDRRRN